MTDGGSALPYGPAVLRARIRTQPEDFRVDELPSFDSSGAGEHVLLTIEKRCMNTAFVARRIAEWARVPELAVSYAGMKDRHAITTQRFSVQLPGREAPDVATLQFDDPASGQRLRVIDASRHARKLQRGALRGNRFELHLRDVEGDRDAIAQRLQQVRDAGFPNAFGAQRFGHAGGNLDAARRMFQGMRVRREQRGLLLSAARSELFNRVLDARIRAGTWNTGLPGEVWMLDGTHSVFGPEPELAALRPRIDALDIHPTGPLWGRGSLRTEAACRVVEEAALAETADLRSGLEAAGLNQERRSLRVPARSLQWEWAAGGALVLAFELPAGSYATSLLATLGPCEDAAAATGVEAPLPA